MIVKTKSYTGLVILCVCALCAVLVIALAALGDQSKQAAAGTARASTHRFTATKFVPTQRPIPTRTNTPNPNGPWANLSVEVQPQVVPCTPYGTNGCQWTFSVIFHETGGVRVIIEREGEFYYDQNGAKYLWDFMGGEDWNDFRFDVQAASTVNHLTRNIHVDTYHPDHGIVSVKFEFEGHDENGHPISVEARATFAAP